MKMDFLGDMSHGGGGLNSIEETQLFNEGTSQLYETTLPQQFSRNYGGRNSVSQIANDAQDLFKAAKKDLEALRIPLKNSGMSDADIEKAFELVNEMNRKKDYINLKYGFKHHQQRFFDCRKKYISLCIYE